jgi:nitrite reductase (NADH) small subunit
MTRWIEAARLADVPPGAAREVVVGETVVALVNVDGEVFALDGICSHQGGPLGGGRVEGRTLTCPWHGWQYDAPSGVHRTSGRACQRVYPVKVDEGAVLVDLEGDPV